MWMMAERVNVDDDRAHHWSGGAGLAGSTLGLLTDLRLTVPPPAPPPAPCSYDMTVRLWDYAAPEDALVRVSGTARVALCMGACWCLLLRPYAGARWCLHATPPTCTLDPVHGCMLVPGAALICQGTLVSACHTTDLPSLALLLSASPPGAHLDGTETVIQAHEW